VTIWHAVRLRAYAQEAAWNKNPRLDVYFIISGPARQARRGLDGREVQTQPEVDRISRFDNTVFVAMAGGCRNEQVHSIHTGARSARHRRLGLAGAFEQNCNIENVSQTMLQTEFAGIFIVSMPDGMTSDALHTSSIPASRRSASRCSPSPAITARIPAGGGVRTFVITTEDQIAKGSSRTFPA